MTELFLVLGVVALSIALRTFDQPLLRRLGAVGVLAASFLALYLPTGSILAGLAGVATWFLLPWVELLTRIRRLRMPLSKSLEKQPPPGSGRFPDLGGLTAEIEEEGFEHVCDTGWDWDGSKQFFRVFYHEEERLQAAICFTEQDRFAWAFFSITSRCEDGRSFRTSNLPFASPMKVAPEVILHRDPKIERFAHLLDEHRFWMDAMAFDPEHFVDEDPERIPELIEEETGRQIRHNLDAGLISLAETAETFRYSWRGLCYLYVQLVKDMVKLS